MTSSLSLFEITSALSTLAEWSYDPDRRALRRNLVFPGFGAALGAMIEIGIAAERADHHPEWTNVFDRLDIWLTTHDVGGVSEKDVWFAAEIDRIVAGRLAPKA